MSIDCYDEEGIYSHTLHYETEGTCSICAEPIGWDRNIEQLIPPYWVHSICVEELANMGIDP